jgi:hypothetical protein
MVRLACWHKNAASSFGEVAFLTPAAFPLPLVLKKGKIFSNVSRSFKSKSGSRKMAGTLEMFVRDDVEL